MPKDRVTLEPVADDYSRRCRSIGLERRSIQDLQDALNHAAFKARHHQLLDELAEEYRQSGQTVGSVAAPADLAAMLKKQAARLIEAGAAAEAKVAAGKYREELMAAVTPFSWRQDFAAIGLNRVALVDFRLRGQFLAEAGGVNCYIAPDDCTLYKGVALPEGVAVIQGQWSAKYRGKSPRWCRANFHPLEQGGVVKEGLTAFLHEGKPLLEECYIDLSGSVSGRGSVPFLCLCFGEPGLYDSFDGFAGPCYGSFSRGKCPSGTG